MAKAATRKRAKKTAARKKPAQKTTVNKKAAPKGPLYLTEADVQRLVTVKDAIATLELTFETWPDPTTTNLPRQRAQIGKGSFNLMGAAWGGSGATGPLLMFGHIVAGSIWAIFHILIVVLQAFIFMMLALVYIGQAHEGH